MAVPAVLVEAIRALPGYDPATFDPAAFVAGLSDDQIAAIMEPINAAAEFTRYHKFEALFPDDGPLRRELYRKHTDFFAAGLNFRERCFMAGNRVGKTVAGGYEMTCHLTGLYPAWWKGRKFRSAIDTWAAGDTNETTRDIIQRELLGDIAFVKGRKTVDGSGIIPRHLITDRITWKQGVADLVDTVQIKHKSGNISRLGFKSFDQGRKVFQGTSKHVIWLDEECPVDVYGECLIRTATVDGLVMTTFTPLSGISEVVLSFLGENMRPGG